LTYVSTEAGPGASKAFLRISVWTFLPGTALPCLKWRYSHTRLKEKT